MPKIIVTNKNSSSSSSGGVILNPPLKEKKKQISPSKRWCFTLNNYTNEHVEKISSIVPEICNKYIVGKEVGESGTPHLQGFVEFKKKVRPLRLLDIPEIHWEKARGNDMSQNYCGKDGDVILNFGIPKPVALMTYDLLREQQKVIADKYKIDEDPLFGRHVHWYWEEKGGWGKSQLATHMIDFMGAMEVSGASSDILCGVEKWIEQAGEAPRVIIFDIPRVNRGHVSYQAIEKIKDGKFFSGKYESGMSRFNRPWIICFSNEEPNYESLSEDRWIVEKLTH